MKRSTLPIMLAITVAFLFGAHNLLAQEEEEATAAKPAEAEEPKEQTEIEKRLAEIDKQWRELTTRLALLRREFSEATPERQEAIKIEWKTIFSQGEKIRSQYIATAEKRYVELEGKNKHLTMLFIKQLYDHVENPGPRSPRTENYEEAARIAQMMHEMGCENHQFYSLAAIAFNAVGEFELAAKYLEKASDKQTLSDLAKEIVPSIDYHRKFYPEELATREAEADDNLPRVLLKTSKGDIELELFENEAPNTVANFISLIDKKYYDGLTFHRVLPSFMAQGGCPKGDGTGGPGYSIDCEVDDPGARKHYRGSLSMAHSGPNTGGSQFFITFTPKAHLDGLHTVFGRVVDGIEVLAELQRRDPDLPNAPEPDRIIKAQVLSRQNHPYIPKVNPGAP